jgi:hypothetical protein
MRQFFRQPLTWLVLGEFVIVAALVVVAWHALASVSAGSLGPLVVPAGPAPQDTAVPQPSAGVLFPPGPAGPLLLPGLNVDPDFWRARLAALNEAEQQVEALEWRIVHSALDTIHRYVESVVVPAVERAEKGGKMR